MADRRRRPLLVVLAAALVVVGVAASHFKTSNPSTLSNGLSANGVESAALYCTGLSSASDGVEGHVVFLNTSNGPRTVLVDVVSDTHRTATVTLHLAAYASQSVSPASLVSGSGYAVAAEAVGGDVVGEEVTSGGADEVPCTSSGVTGWYGAGFDTLVGSSASLSIYNPTATPAVLDVTTFSSSGFGAPAAFRGLSLAPHTQVELKLGTQIVNSSNIGVHVSVLRGSLVVEGVQRSGAVVSLVPGSTSTSRDVWFPRVTTVENSVAQLRVANPGSRTVTVTARVGLAPYHVAPLTLQVAPYSSGKVVITPNPAIPAHGYATVQLTSSAPVVTSLATGTAGTIALSSPGTPDDEFLISDFTGRGFNAATVTDTSSQAVTVTFHVVGANGATGSARLGGATTESILGLFRGVTSLSGKTLLITSSRSVLLVTTTLPSNPQGVTVVAPLDGR
jgi:hypothetical protein